MISARICTRSLASRFESGSSKRKTDGLRTMARPTATRWRWPPDPASAMFSRDGFVVSLSVIPFEATGVSVRLQNFGNVKPGKLPVPPGAKSVYQGDPTAMYDTEATVAATADAIRNLFAAQGWTPYGKAGDSDYFKHNAILATATVSSAPAQGGKTMIQYSNQLISADIPAPPDVEVFALRR